MDHLSVFGDCLIELEDFEDCSVDMILADLPYKRTKNKWDVLIDLTKLWPIYRRIIKPNGVIALFGQGMFSAQLMISNPEMHRYNLVWEKTSATGFLNAKERPLSAHEDILIFYKKPPQYTPVMTFGHKRKVSSAKHKLGSKATENYGKHGLTSYDSTARYPRSVLKFKKDVQKSALHSIQKPVALLEMLINMYSKPGDLVVDNCMGSGSTGIACKKTGRRFIGIEKDKDIFNIAIKRFDEYGLSTT